MESQQAVAQLFTAHERGILTLQTEVEQLKSELKRLRADLLVTFKFAGLCRANSEQPSTN
jgi:hypothetical protein